MDRLHSGHNSSGTVYHQRTGSSQRICTSPTHTHTTRRDSTLSRLKHTQFSNAKGSITHSFQLNHWLPAYVATVVISLRYDRTNTCAPTSSPHSTSYLEIRIVYVCFSLLHPHPNPQLHCHIIRNQNCSEHINMLQRLNLITMVTGFLLATASSINYCGGISASNN